jgi:hypothetical protein
MLDGLIHGVRHEEKSGGRYGPPFAFVDVLGPGRGVRPGAGSGRVAGVVEVAGADLCRKGREVNRERIQELIQQAKDPVQQATLLVLSNFDSALESNTRATEVIATELQSHRIEFSEFRSNVHTHINEDRDMKVSIKTGWMAGILFFSVVNLVGGWLITRAVNSNDDQDRIIRSLEITMNQLKADIAAHRVEVK